MKWNDDRASCNGNSAIAPVHLATRERSPTPDLMIEVNRFTQSC
ncbi:hypothetical protein [Stenomitos frigidus]|nr:hypothetical protein [Stenomitos frigidus]